MHRDVFDVLVVYSDRIAKSATSEAISPFPQGYEEYNTAFAYFLDLCRKNGLNVALSTTKDVIGPGECSNYWAYENEVWEKVKNTCFSSFIFDKFSATRPEQKLKRDLLYSSPQICSYTDPALHHLLNDKYETYRQLEHYSIPTVRINNTTKEGIHKALEALKQLVLHHPYNNDFSSGLVLKDNHGSSGNNIYKIDSDYEEVIYKILQENQDILFILQPFVNFDKGYAYNGFTRPTDIRLIYLNGNIVQTFIRMAKENDFRCNIHQGAVIEYTSQSDIPSKVVELSEKTTSILHTKHSLFSLDFIVSNNNHIYLLEGNIYPGFVWSASNEDEKMTKNLIDMVVKNLANRVDKPDNKINSLFNHFFDHFSLPF